MGKLKKCKKENKRLAFELEEAKNGEGLYHNLLLKIGSIIKSSASEQDKIDIIVLCQVQLFKKDIIARNIKSAEHQARAIFPLASHIINRSAAYFLDICPDSTPY